MKKLVIALLMCLIIVTGCSISSNEEGKDLEEPDSQDKVEGNSQENEEKEDLTLQVLKIDEEAGVTIENNDIYRGLEDMIAQDPAIGANDDFTVRTMNIYNAEDGVMLILLGINRLDVPIKDISFDLTLGNDSGEYVWKGLPIMLSESDAGIIQPNGAVPILMDLSKEEEELLRDIDQNNIQVVVENFDTKTVE